MTQDKHAKFYWVDEIAIEEYENYLTSKICPVQIKLHFRQQK